MPHNSKTFSIAQKMRQLVTKESVQTRKDPKPRCRTHIVLSANICCNQFFTVTERSEILVPIDATAEMKPLCSKTAAQEGTSEISPNPC
ncbi:hypothetical protein J6590_063707 [Homalodisca vitripennis]|nr:hypothetical protein J6590_063707 [Homalodisca vitripennis]